MDFIFHKKLSIIKIFRKGERMFDFLEQYIKRMKNVGAHAFIHKNSLQKTTWKNYGFDEWEPCFSN